ncbi:hypothetical protein Leryth_024726 [Lithospermum erythrorhizon]|nr:hypothetical protein Leryth_024726 [Lithospermum erythrorhizon]
MGCSASKDDVIVTEYQHSEPQCKYSKSSSSSRLPRNLSLPPKSKCDNHLVFLTSTTYGFLATQPSKSPKICDSASFSPHSVINTWELMEGLDEFTSDFVKEPEVNDIVEYNDSKPLWQHLSVESLLSKMDPNVDSSYRKALRSKRNLQVNCMKSEFLIRGIELNLSGIQDKIVLYYTSMRGIRKTYQDCCEIRMILRDYGVFVDERDTSMDPAYRKELQDMLKGKAMILPQVFVKGSI